MKISGIDHIGIVTKSIDESAAFYRDFLGFIPGETEEVTELRMKIHYLRKGNEVVELLEPQVIEGASFGLKHIAFLCHDIEAVLREAEDKNLSLLHKTPMSYKNLRFFFCKAPDGELIEFVEREEK